MNEIIFKPPTEEEKELRLRLRRLIIKALGDELDNTIGKDGKVNDGNSVLAALYMVIEHTANCSLMYNPNAYDLLVATLTADHVQLLEHLSRHKLR